MPGSGRQLARLAVAVALITAIFLAVGLGDLLLFIAILIIIVMLHELGHFATAKWAGMKVTEYFVGFGPRLWSMRRGETEYGIKALPLGGYVRITGFTVLEDVPDEDEPRAYRQQPFWKRIIVASAGSAMHFFIALVLALIVAFSFGTYSNNAQVLSLDHWVGVAHTPAQLAGLQAGDEIVSVNHKSISSVNALIDKVQHSTGKELALGVERDGTIHYVDVTPRSGKGIKLAGKDGVALKDRGYIGVGLEPATKSLGPWGAVVNAADSVGDATSSEVSGIVTTFSPSGLSSVLHQVTNSKDASEAVKHPGTQARPVSLVGIASLGVQAQQAGLESLLELLILINVVFGLINMLPMLPLDGGHVAVAAYEWIRTKKNQAYYRADITKLMPVALLFVAFLAVFVLSGLFLDITHPLQNPFSP
jgi:membrane-associated protease RseP (regulator of RpoE activity)